MSVFNTTRRLLIQAAVLTPVIGLKPMGAHVTEIAQVDNRLKTLLSRRAELIAECDRLERQWRMIWPTLPDWCRSGPKYLNANGEPFGERVGWPAARVNLIKISEDRWLARPSPYDLRELFEAERIDLSLKTAAANYRLRSRQLRTRLHRRRDCYAEWELPTAMDWRPLEAEIERIDERLALIR